MKQTLKSIGLVAFFSFPVVAASTDPAPTHPLPLRPNPTQSITHPFRPVPNDPIPLPRAHQATEPTKLGGVQPGLPIEVKGPEYTIKVAEPSQDTNAWVLMNFRTANSNLTTNRTASPDGYTKVDGRASVYSGRYSDRWKQAADKFHPYYTDNSYRYFCSRWFDKGFYGGYYYPVRISDDITGYFDYPMVEWFYSGDADVDFYKASYGADYTTYPVTVFPYAAVYYPTETLRDLATDVSGVEAWKQAFFRDGIVVITDQLGSLISTRLKADYIFGDGEIVVTHYENLRNEAYVIEGFVDGATLHVPFRSIVDLNGASYSAVYAVFDADPTGQDVDILSWLSDRILQLGGDPLTAFLEPPQ